MVGRGWGLNGTSKPDMSSVNRHGGVKELRCGSLLNGGGRRQGKPRASEAGSGGTGDSRRCSLDTRSCRRERGRRHIFRRAIV